jgi:hypothetical protein
MKQSFAILFLLLFCLCYSQSSFAQLNKNVWMVGGDFSYNSGTTNRPNQNSTTTTTDLQFSPAIGYFIDSRLPIGIRTILQVGRFHYKDNSGTMGYGKSNYFSVGPFVRYYFLKKSDQIFNFFAEANYLIGNAQPDIGTARYTFSRYSLMVGPTIFFNSSVGLELSLGYYHQKPNNDAATSGLQTKIGFQVYLENK